jgi:hypothetical protein
MYLIMKIKALYLCLNFGYHYLIVAELTVSVIFAFAHLFFLLDIPKKVHK